jgi:hypothetical protein
MKAKGKRKPSAGRPKHYLKEQLKSIDLKGLIMQPKPFKLGSGWMEGPDEHWVQFVLQEESLEVSLLIPKDGDANEALREWYVRRAAKDLVPFDVANLVEIWNYGSAPKMERKACGEVHIAGSRSGGWGPEVLLAHEIFSRSGWRGWNPYHVAAVLEPDRRLPFFDSSRAQVVPWTARWIALPLDLGRPLEPQFEELRSTCVKIRDYAHEIAGTAPPRPDRYETGRDVLAFTMKYSAGMTNREIARALFSKEREETAQEKVKDILKRIRKLLREAFPEEGGP